jgi:hypothetical protein
MKLKRGVLFPEKQKEEPTVIVEQEIKKSKIKSLSVFFSDLFFDVDLQKMRKYIVFFIVILSIFIVLIFIVNDFKKYQEEKIIKKITLVQEEINKCYGMLNALKTFKASEKRKKIIKSSINIQLDSLIVVREKLKAE